MNERASIVVFYTRFINAFDRNTLAAYLEVLPGNTQQKILKFRKWEDAHACLFGNLLLLEGLKYLGFGHLALTQIQYTKYNRPYFVAGIDFNISHSGQYVVCAFITGGRVGVDIEQIIPLNIEEFKSLFTPAEWQDISLSKNTLVRFFEYWTKKEAVVKADGQGLNMSLQEIKIMSGSAKVANMEWYLSDLLLDAGYKTCLASNRPISEVIVKQLCF